jgi:hypothetical protein
MDVNIFLSECAEVAKAQFKSNCSKKNGKKMAYKKKKKKKQRK